MDHLKTVLSEAVGKVCQQLLMYNAALKYESLLAVTVDNVTTLVFNLQGYAGSPATELTAWTRRPQTESLSMKNSIEETLMEVCWEKVAEVTVIKLEGLLTVVLDNTEVIIVSIEKTAFAPVIEETKKEIEEVAVSQTEQEEVTQVEAIVESVQISQPDGAVMNQSDDVPHVNPQDVIMVVMGNDQQGDDRTTATVVTTLNQATLEGETGKWTSLLTTDWEEDPQAATDLFNSEKTDSIEAAATLSELAMVASQPQNQQIIMQAPQKSKPRRSTVIVCSYCGDGFPNARTLIHHMTQVHDIKNANIGLGTIKCQNCDKTFLTKKTMKHHNCINRCDQCDFVGKTKKILNGHIFRVHQLPQPNPDNTITCSICGQVFRNYTKLRDHIQFHSVDTLSNITLRKVMDMDNQRLKGACTCVLCDKKFEHSWHMKQHMVYHAVHGPINAFNIIKQNPVRNNPARWCTLIHGKVKSLSKLALAVVAKPCTRTASEYKCLMCNKSRMSPFYIMRHMERHLGQLRKGNREGSFKKAYSCMICFSKFASEKTLEMHKKYVHGMKIVDFNNRLTCEICGTVFQNIGNLDRHMSLHRFRNTHGEKWKTVRPHQCKQCNRTFASEVVMARHIVESHPPPTEGDIQASELEEIDEDITVTVKLEGAHDVPGTSLHTVKPEGLELEHEGDKGTTIVTLDPDKVMHACPICNKKFPEKVQVLRHVKTHKFGKGAVRKYKCDNCKSKFLYENSLRKHQRACLRNQGTVPHSQYFCDICQLYLGSLISLHRHRNRCHNPNFDPKEDVDNVDFRCDVCSAKLSSRMSLAKHKQYWHKSKDWKKTAKTPSKKIVCDECGARMHNSANLRRHKKRWHDPNNPNKTYKQHVCSQCGEMFFNVASFQAHLHEYHNPENEKLEYMIEINKSVNDEDDTEEAEPNIKREGSKDESEDDAERIIEVLPQIQLVALDEQETMHVTSTMDKFNMEISEEDGNSEKKTQVSPETDEINTPDDDKGEDSTPHMTSKRGPKKKTVSEQEKSAEDVTPRRMSKRTPKATFKVLEGDGFSKKRKLGDTIECEECGLEMSSTTNLKKHIDRVHTEKKTKKTPSQAKGTPKRGAKQENFTCSECGMSCSSKANLERHMTRWHGNQSTSKRVKREK